MLLLLFITWIVYQLLAFRLLIAGKNFVCRFEAVLVQEMLILIIQIVKERRFCGLSTFGYLCRELIHKLAAGDATHSQLLKTIPREFSKSEQLRKALDMLAMHSNPSGMKQVICLYAVYTYSIAL